MRVVRTRNEDVLAPIDSCGMTTARSDFQPLRRCRRSPVASSYGACPLMISTHRQGSGRRRPVGNQWPASQSSMPCHSRIGRSDATMLDMELEVEPVYAVAAD